MEVNLKGLLAAFLSVSILFSVPASASSLLSDKDTSKPKTSATATAPAKTETILCRTGNFTYSVPKAWTQKDMSPYRYYYYNTQAFLFVQKVSHPDFKTTSKKDAIDGIIQGIESDGTAKVESQEDMTVNALDITKITVNTKSGETLTESQSYILLDGQDIVVFNFAQASKISEDFQVYIDQVVSTIKYSPVATESKKEEPGTVYWTPNGKSYHFTENCATLKRSKTIKDGTKSEAAAAGKSDPCNICANG